MSSSTDHVIKPFGFDTEAPLFIGLNVAGYSSIVGVGVLAGVFTVTAAKFVPLLAVITGLFRFAGACFAHRDETEETEKEKLKGHIYRGVMEMAQLGPILLIVDLFATCCYREAKVTS